MINLKYTCQVYLGYAIKNDLKYFCNEMFTFKDSLFQNDCDYFSQMFWPFRRRIKLVSIIALLLLLTRVFVKNKYVTGKEAF